MNAARHILEKYKFGIPLVIVAAAEVVFLIAVYTRRLPQPIKELGEDYGQTGLLVMLAHFLIFANTSIFLVECGLFAHRVNKLEDIKASSKVQLLGGVAALLLIISTFSAGMMVVYALISLWRGNAAISNWESLLEWHEGISFTIYALFLVADWCILSCCSIWLNKATETQASRSDVARFQSDVKLFIFGCDAPGLVGAFFIVAASTALHHHLSDFYWHGVVAGALGMHIIFSQAALAFLSVCNNQPRVS